MWNARDMEPGEPVSATTSRDLALVSLRDCSNPSILSNLGGVPVDTTARSRLVRERFMPVSYIGYPGDRPLDGALPKPFTSDTFPEMWQIDAETEITVVDDQGAEESCWDCREVFWLHDVGVKEGASGGPVFGPSDTPALTSSGRVVRPVVSVAAVSQYDPPWGNPNGYYTEGPFITEEMCRGMWAAASGAGLRTPVCLSAVGAPSPPTKVVARPGKRSIRVSWSASASSEPGQIRYRVVASPGSRSCTTTVNSCTITGLTPRKKYTVTVRAYGPFGISTGAVSRPVFPTR